jgi:hypothetical protein
MPREVRDNLIICRETTAHERRYYCGAPAMVLGDFKIHTQGGADRDCDRAVCRAHAKHVGKNVDWCTAHVEDVQR